jgi:tRNA-splicing ligase RtcB (3'-phosphate/5'-hydroxy nucleic acid ligase)
MSDIRLEKIDDYRWLVPEGSVAGMRVPGLIYTDEKSITEVILDGAAEQVANAASIPGIVGRSLAMPDIHRGYGFPIGGVAATDPAAGGVISPGGVGYDINCGVRLIRTDLTLEDVKPKIEILAEALFSGIPCGLGSSS